MVRQALTQQRTPWESGGRWVILLIVLALANLLVGYEPRGDRDALSMLTTPGRRVEQHAVDNRLQLYGQTLRQEDIDRLQVQLHGFSLPANTSSLAHRRDPLERLSRYTARGAISRERLVPDEGGDLLYTISRHLIRLQETAHHLPTLKHRPYADGLLPTRNQASQPQHISFYCKLLRSMRSTLLLVTIS